MKRILPFATACLVALLIGSSAQAAEGAVEFNRDIRPILSNKCFACHGPDQNKRKADLRLDQEEGAHADRNGVRAIVPGKPEESELIRRVTSTDAEEKMPPVRSEKTLSKTEIELLRRWIADGGKYQQHWSLIPPQRPATPAVKPDWPRRNAIDHFIQARLQREGLAPAAEADRRTLIRRLYFDLTGLPPAPERVDAFLSDTSGDAYENLVDELLASPHHGERMAMYWLDLVRFADSIGYHSDNPRDIAPYRDYVIRSFNENKRFDQFTTEQLAGDLLPNAALWQKVASGYNRLLQTTEEGGAQPKEYAAKYMADRVRNLGTVWLGATLGCCECHNHKFDPFTMKDFYSLQAFFADVREAPVGRREPGMLVPTAEQEAALKKVDEKLGGIVQKVQAPAKELAAAAMLTRLNTAWFDPAFAELVVTQKQKAELTSRIPRSLVSVSENPRPIRILPRGNWLDDSGEIVQPSIPGILQNTAPKPLLEKPRATRLDLAQWIVSRENPLTARVFVNRLWKLFFGQGLAKPLDDLGMQGEWPSHPELLDWLAVEFMEPSPQPSPLGVREGWDVRHMIKLMVMSHTYRQTSAPTKMQKERDPENRLWSRQARYRIDAEMVRDNALEISGLLVRRVGGESVKPYQPGGYWEYLNFPRRTYQHDHGAAQYRRGLYTHWQRTFLHPSLLAFDAPSREECTCERPRSNIPQQALVLLNDPTYVEASRVFAERILREGGKTDSERLAFAYRRALSRVPAGQEEQILLALKAKHLEQFNKDTKAAQSLISTGEWPVPKDLDPAELAAWTSVARAILNLHETMTRN